MPLEFSLYIISLGRILHIRFQKLSSKLLLRVIPKTTGIFEKSLPLSLSGSWKQEKTYAGSWKQRKHMQRKVLTERWENEIIFKKTKAGFALINVKIGICRGKNLVISVLINLCRQELEVNMKIAFYFELL